MIKVTCRVDSYDELMKPSFLVNNHWNRRELVVLDFGDFKITVKAADLKTAIENCTNTNPY